MSNRRVKSLATEDDGFDYDDYDDEEEQYAEEEELSPEDQEQLRLGTIEVRKSLGPGYTVTDKEIQDGLWNYYYDVAKTVALIKGNIVYTITHFDLDH